MDCALQSRKPGADYRARKLNLDLSIIVPAWNEEWCIYHTLTVLMGHFRGASYEVLVVDDGSRDGTAAEVRRWSRDNPDVAVRCLCLGAQRGKGGAVKAGALASSGSWVAYIDADLDIPADNLLRLYELAQEGEQDVLAGSKRQLTWGRRGVPLGRKLVSVGFSDLVQLLFRLPVRDTQTGIKLFRGSWLRKAAAEARVDGFLFDLELLAMASQDGLKMREVCVSYTPQREANRIGLRKIAACVVELGRIKAALRHRGHTLHGLTREVRSYADIDA